jgi:CRISPR-associated endoribonuclease Cas6
MRIKVQFRFNGKLTLPISYNNLIQSFIYQNISDLDKRNKLHEEGYQVGKRKLKLFTFSRLNGKFLMNKDQKEITFLSPVSLVISFFEDGKADLISDLTTSLFKNNNLYLGKNLVTIGSITPCNFDFQKDKYLIKMLSPIAVYKTQKVNSKKVTKYYTPWDLEFEQLILQNIKTKLKAIQKDFDYSTFKIKSINPPNEKDGKVIGYKNINIKANYGSYLIEGDRNIIRLLYDSGIGSANSEGFGCFEIIG